LRRCSIDVYAVDCYALETDWNAKYVVWQSKWNSPSQFSTSI
jgi:hypothetical protein